MTMDLSAPTTQPVLATGSGGLSFDNDLSWNVEFKFTTVITACYNKRKYNQTEKHDYLSICRLQQWQI